VSDQKKEYEYLKLLKKDEYLKLLEDYYQPFTPCEIMARLTFVETDSSNYEYIPSEFSKGLKEYLKVEGDRE
jgi:hypothetical protein